MIKDDERARMRIYVEEGELGSNRKPWAGWPWDRIKMAEKRALRIQEKWEQRGWFESGGVSFRSGFLTRLGMEEIAKLLGGAP
jgi:hypothetical protein